MMLNLNLGVCVVNEIFNILKDETEQQVYDKLNELLLGIGVWIKLKLIHRIRNATMDPLYIILFFKSKYIVTKDQ